MRKNGFFTFCFSFIPGAGQMYQGYMKRGASILGILTILCMLTVIISTPILMFPIMALFAYSFFDTYYIRGKIGTVEQIKDSYLWNEKEFESIMKKFNISKKHSILGIILILFGGYTFLNSVLGDLAYYYKIPFISFIVRCFSNYLPPIMVATICIYVGIKFISNKDE